MKENQPKHFDEGRNASRFEDGEQAFSVVGKIVQGAGGAAGRFYIVGVLHGPHNGRHHLRGSHDGVTRGLLLRKLVHHHSCLIYHHLMKKEEIETFAHFDSLTALAVFKQSVQT